MIQVNSLTKKYKEVAVLNIDSLEIPSGEICGLVGNNGAGKTTFFSLLLDLIKASTGHIINNQVQVDMSEDWKPFTSAFIDESFLIGYLTPEEYFYFIGELRGLNQQDVDLFLQNFEDFFHGEILQGKKYLRDLSKGNQKKVGIVASFIGEPKVIILDEPFANLDPSTQIRLKKLIGTYKDNPEVTLLISSHDLAHVTEVCQRIVVLNKGQIVKDIQTSERTLRDLEGFFSEEILNETLVD
ncbi:putative ABC transporter ATP-binding protein [Galbibacter marinus]|uniref:Putative ABC transporter ATP-binding protein n=1 Tax=Galbibacter marinus TaxID=555500 RepID=K2QP90_9FLAO|nr:ATP-binding cassette domain-containing protein [Galbibacter marinus]EKF56747.1 putative ABC transporter ATP-binding protein [Galbibacter marinus]